MAIRTIKQCTDRGSIKDLVAKAKDPIVSELSPLPSELRMKKLYEYAQANKDNNLQEALGFITTDYISDKSALPLSVYRIRRIVDDIKSKSGDKIEQFSQQLSGCFEEKLSDVLGKEYIKQKAMIKKASNRKPPSFWRVNEMLWNRSLL
jgi:hypothetical protein